MGQPVAPTATLGDILRSIAFYVVFYAVTSVLVLVGLVTIALPARTTAALVRSWSASHRWCCRTLLGIRVRVEGHLPDHPVLVAMRHESFFEAIDLPFLVDNPLIFAKESLLRIPLWGRLGEHYGLIGVDRGAGARMLRTMLSEARRRSAEEGGRVLAIFPEGTRVPHDSAPPLQSGFAGLYKLLDLPVVAIAVDSGPLYHRRWKRPGTITYRIGAEIAQGLPRPAIEELVHKAINGLHP